MRALVASVCAAVLVAVWDGHSRADERVDITATDGVQLIGHLAGTTGPGVVLVPAPERDTRSWETAASALAGRGFRVLRFDLRGHGDSDGPTDPTAIERDVEGAFRYLIGRKIRPVYLVGEGAGGSAALTVASKVSAPGVVMLGNPSPRPSAAAAVRLEIIPGDLASANVREALVRFLSDPNPERPE